jgi:hypothetical protein
MIENATLVDSPISLWNQVNRTVVAQLMAPLRKPTRAWVATGPKTVAGVCARLGRRLKDMLTLFETALSNRNGGSTQFFNSLLDFFAAFCVKSVLNAGRAHHATA